MTNPVDYRGVRLRHHLRERGGERGAVLVGLREHGIGGLRGQDGKDSSNGAAGERQADSEGEAVGDVGEGEGERGDDLSDGTVRGVAHALARSINVGRSMERGREKRKPRLRLRMAACTYVQREGE